MDPLNNIQGLLQEYRKLDRSTQVKRNQDPASSLNNESVREKESSAESTRDSVSISDDSKTLLQREKEVARYLKELEQIKTVDEEQLNRIKNRLESGYYNEPAVIEKVKHDLLVSTPIAVTDSFENPAPRETETASRTEELRQADIEAIRENIRTKAYDSDQVLNTVVNKILGIE